MRRPSTNCEKLVIWKYLRVLHPLTDIVIYHLELFCTWRHLQEMETRGFRLTCLIPRFCILLLLPWVATAQRKLPAIFVFGDSLSDAGNNNYIRTLSKANSPPNGMDFPGGYATGRFTNGRTTVDIIGNHSQRSPSFATDKMEINLDVTNIT